MPSGVPRDDSVGILREPLSVARTAALPLLPMAMAALRRRPECLARRMGDPRKTLRNSSGASPRAIRGRD